MLRQQLGSWMLHQCNTARSQAMHLVAISSGMRAVDWDTDGRGHAMRINAEACLAVAAKEVQQAQCVPPKYQATAAVLSV